jgi:anti-anti-sigma factor
MDISIERRAGPDDATIDLVCSGRLDAESGVELEHAVAEELQRGRHAIRLDLSAVGFLSSAGIRILFNTHRAAKAAKGTCLISAASPPVARVLELTRLAPILMESQGGAGQAAPAAGAATGAGGPSAAIDTVAGGILFVGLEQAGSGSLQGVLVGAADAVLQGRATEAVTRPVPRHGFGLGIAALADDKPWAAVAGEAVAACGAVFHRAPQPFAAIDYLLGAGSLVAEARVAAGLFWEGLPRGRAGFEPAADETAVRFDELAARLLEQSGAEAIALVVVGELHGLVGAELIRPLAEATSADQPWAGSAGVAARWLSFSREPVHARHTALIVGVATRGRPSGPLASFVRPLGTGEAWGHAHAVVFPLRSLKRGAADLAATVDDLAASEPIAVMHLVGDPQPVLGSGQSELVRGSCWFAPLSVAGASGPEASR